MIFSSVIFFVYLSPIVYRRSCLTQWGDELKGFYSLSVLRAFLPGRFLRTFFLTTLGFSSTDFLLLALAGFFFRLAGEFLAVKAPLLDEGLLSPGLPFLRFLTFKGLPSCSNAF